MAGPGMHPNNQLAVKLVRSLQKRAGGRVWMSGG